MRVRVRSAGENQECGWACGCVPGPTSMIGVAGSAGRRSSGYIGLQPGIHRVAAWADEHDRGGGVGG